MKAQNFYITSILSILFTILTIDANCQSELYSSFITNGDSTYILRIQNDSVISQDILWTQDTSLLEKVNYSYSPEQAAYNSGFNWISFPRLERQNNDPYDAQTLLSGITPLPSTLTLTGLPDQSNQQIHLYKDGFNWSGLLTNVQSTRGYILALPASAEQQYTLNYSGTRLRADYPINVFTGYENWVGYFLPETQDPLVALTNIWPNLKSIKAQYWAAANMGTEAKPEWVISKPTPLKYGEMLKLKVYHTSSFTWYRGGSGFQENVIDQPVNYAYVEQADYTPFFIDVDTTNPPLEMGAFVNDSCIGACTVATGDTTALIKGYLNGNSGDSVVFSQYFGNKSSEQKRIRRYYVYNVEKGYSENRTIKVGEHKSFYYISFKNNKFNKTADDFNDLSLKVYPNPVHHTAYIEFVLPSETDVSIKTYNTSGQVVQYQVASKLEAGTHKIVWPLNTTSGKNLIPGIYLISITAGNRQTDKKIIVQ